MVTVRKASTGPRESVYAQHCTRVLSWFHEIQTLLSERKEEEDRVGHKIGQASFIICRYSKFTCLDIY